MLKQINVRFFVANYDNTTEIEHCEEIEHSEFVERYAENPHARIDIELHSVYANGVRQLCITLNEESE